MKAVILHLDGMGFDYFKRSDLKFANSLPGYISRIKVYPSFFGNEVSLFTGISPDHHNMPDIFVYDPDNVPFKNNILFDLLPRKFLKYLAYLYGYATYIDINLPKSGYRQFVPVSQKQAHDLKSSFLNILRKNGFSVKYIRSKNFSFNHLKKEIIKNDCIYAVNMTYDKLLHDKGINKKIKTDIDPIIKRLHNFLSNNFGDDFYLILLSDHGMINTKGKIDLDFDQESLYFIDSTILRVWTNDKHFRIQSKDAKLYESKTIDLRYKYFKKYLANPGFIFSPNFFQGGKFVNGMHGYDDISSNHDAFLFVHSPKYSTRLETQGVILNLAPTILSLFGIKKPNFMTGRVMV